MKEYLDRIPDSSYKRAEIIGDCLLLQGDCLDILPHIGKVDAVITDPPYGIGCDKGVNSNRSFNGSKPIKSNYYPNGNWDSSRPDKEIFDIILKISKSAIIWGGNYFADFLPAQGKWLWWDKCQTMPTYGDGELAWTNLSGTTPKKFIYANNKLFADRVERFHPTQKPLPLMKWCIEQLPNKSQSMLDPFMGSGTTGVACASMGKKFIGIERESQYFDIACRRIEEAYSQPDMFIAPSASMKQEAFL